jgi:hypothetical protein
MAQPNNNNRDLPLLKEGDYNNTALHLHIINPIIKMYNRLNRMSGKNGIKVVSSDSNIIISIDDGKPDDDKKKNNQGNVTNNSGSIQNNTCMCRLS